MEENMSICNKRMTFWGYVLKCFKKYASFEGSARRKEFWSFFIFIYLYMILYSLGLIYLETNYNEPAILFFYGFLGLVPVLPMIAVGVRRMNDVNKDGWHLLYPIYNLYLLLIKGDEGYKYGLTYCESECRKTCNELSCKYCSRWYRIKKSDASDQGFYCSKHCEDIGENLVCENDNKTYSLKNTDSSFPKKYCGKWCEEQNIEYYCRECSKKFICKTSTAKDKTGFCSQEHQDKFENKPRTCRECRENYKFIESSAYNKLEFCSLSHENNYQERQRIEEEKRRREEEERKLREKQYTYHTCRYCRRRYMYKDSTAKEEDKHEFCDSVHAKQYWRDRENEQQNRNIANWTKEWNDKFGL